MSKRKLTYKDFKNYFSNNLQNKDKHAFEKDMMQDAFEEEAFDGLSQLSKTELEADIAELKSTINSKSQKRRVIIPVWFKYAASILILVGVGLSLVYLNSRHWQESMLKEQVSDEMEIGDSILFESEIKVPVTMQDTFKESEVKDLVADNKITKKEKKEVQKTESKVQEKELVPLADVEYDVDMEEELMVNDAIVESDKIEATEILEMEEEVTSNEATEFVQAQPRVEVAKKSREKAVEESPSMMIRGAGTLSRDQEPIYIIDGRPVDFNKMRTIKGLIVSALDGARISNATVSLKKLEAFETYSNTEGEFILTYPDHKDLETIIASHAGMETVEINMEEDTSFIVYMEPEAMAYDEDDIVKGFKREETDKSFNRNSEPPVSLVRYKKQIINNINYSLFNDLKGEYKIQVEFQINPNGSLSNFKFKNVPDKILADEIKRVMIDLGNWLPKVENNRSVSSIEEFTLKIEIK